MKKILYSFMLCAALVACYDNIVALGSHDDSVVLGNQLENMFDGKDGLDPIDSERSSDLHDPEVLNDHLAALGTLSDDEVDTDDSNSSPIIDDASDDQDTLKNDEIHMTNQSNDQDALKDDTDDEVEKSYKNMILENKNEVNSEDVMAKNEDLPMPTQKDFEKSVQWSQKAAERQKDIAEALGNLASSINHEFLSENSDEKSSLDDSRRELANKFNQVKELWLKASSANNKAAIMTKFLAQLNKLGFEPSQELLEISKDLNLKAFKFIDTASKAMIDDLGFKLVFTA